MYSLCLTNTVMFVFCQLPSQLAVALDNKHLQHLVICHPDRSVSLRIEYWLEQTLTEGMCVKFANKQRWPTGPIIVNT